MTEPLVSVVIVTYNSASDIRHCVEAIPAACTASYEIVVLDNRSLDGTLQELADLGVPATRAMDNLGFARGCNAAYQLAAPSSAFLLLLNPDAVAAPGSIDVLLAAAARHHDGAVFGPRIVTPEGLLDPSCAMGRMSWWSTVCFALGLSTLFSKSRWFDPESLGRWRRDDERKVPVIPGTMALIRRVAWDEVGGFDQRYRMYSEDVDLCGRLRDRGWSSWLIPEASAVHRSGASSTPGGKIVLLLRGRVTYGRRAFPAPLGRLTSAFLKVGVAGRACSPSGVRNRLARRASRPSTAQSAWQEAWARRSEWSGGWPDPEHRKESEEV